MQPFSLKGEEEELIKNSKFKILASGKYLSKRIFFRQVRLKNDLWMVKLEKNSVFVSPVLIFKGHL